MFKWEKRRFLKYGHWGTITASRTDKGSVENRKSLMIHNVRWKGMDVRTTLMNTLITQGIENNVGNGQKADTYRYSWKHRLSLSVCLILTSYHSWPYSTKLAFYFLVDNCFDLSNKKDGKIAYLTIESRMSLRVNCVVS